METKLLITDIKQEDLVNLLSTASYGSEIFDIDYDVIVYKKLSCKDEDRDCSEDKCAKCLLEGKKIFVYDNLAEDERDSYGNLPHVWNEEELTMDYTITLNDVIEGIQNCFSSGGYGAECVCNLINYEDGAFDIGHAEYIMQHIVFGEVIYG